MDNPIRVAHDNLKGHWFKGGFNEYETGNKCGMGHLAMAINPNLTFDITNDAEAETFNAVFDSPEYRKASDLMSKIAKEQFPERMRNAWFPWFNDHEDTTEDEVLRIMDKAAVEWDATEGLTD